MIKSTYVCDVCGLESEERKPGWFWIEVIQDQKQLFRHEHVCSTNCLYKLVGSIEEKPREVEHRQTVVVGGPYR